MNYIERNKHAAVDTLLRYLVEHCTDFCEREEGPLDPSEVLPFWYAVDETVLAFTLPSGKRTWVHLIHQGTYATPDPDDLADYGTSLETDNGIRTILDGPLFY